jgi:hypothetical protein
MNATGYPTIPRELCHWITFLTQVLPLRSIPTFLELLIGAMLTRAGFVTEALLLINSQKHWTTYYKWLEAGKWSWLGLIRQFIRLVIRVQGDGVWHLAIDDTLTLRASKKAPASQIHHQHGNKPNLANFVRGQCWVSLAATFKRSATETTAIPLLSRLMPNAGNTGKLVAAKVMMRAVFRLFEGQRVRVLVDCWYMRRIFIEHMNRYGFDVIGQARIDTRLYDAPVARKKGQRGRPRKYGEKYTPKRIAHLKKTTARLMIYGKKQSVRYRSRIVMARFLNGQKVKATWCELLTERDEWTPARLFLSTDIDLTTDQMIESYGLRWSIESMFYQLKELWGIRQAWQQRRQTLSRWVHLTCIGYGLIQLLTLALGHQEKEQLCIDAPWRDQDPITAGRIRHGLERQFRHVNVRLWWKRTCKKYEQPLTQQNAEYT